ncbi:alternate-type signal peptide domain-containing protein [Rhodococcus sp. BP-241]|uniref:alternate-type signal peptide domain-containing protein n=2 Tax=Rhodococcus TaxID=1827 RepID=UPI001C9B1CF1|nr:alternate-type signal peptide domain-containing protein [Rhodococcus sp. BP-241]MBY6706090.1 alternate-type signal peptide domain-containing protein [Rhodococcus sp. BP-241]
MAEPNALTGQSKAILMNKATKGALAAVAAIVLLLGGMGSFALWNSEATTNGGTVTAGDLKITANAAAGLWEQTTSDVKPAGPIPNIATYLVVPGDVVTYTKTYDIEASGNNLLADLSVDLNTITGTGNLKENMVISVSGTSGATALPSTGSAVRIASSDQTVTVKVTFSFPTSVSGLTAQNGTVNLSAFAVKLQQSRTP